jgi:hypothetical protein
VRLKLDSESHDRLGLFRRAGARRSTLADERDGHRVGADAVAGDAAGGWEALKKGEESKG